MHVAMLLQMAGDGIGERVALGSGSAGMSVAELRDQARRVGAFMAERPGERVALVDLNSPAVPLVVFGAAFARKPYVPINYRLTDEQLRAIVARTAPATVIVGEGVEERLGGIDGIEIVGRKELLDVASDSTLPLIDLPAGDPDDVAILLYTSGTTGDPKAAVLRHRNLATYVVTTVEFAAASENEAALVSVPPYHIAGVSSVLSSTYAGRRVVHLEAFEPQAWVDLARAERVTHAMVVPTMLSRILDIVEADGRGLPSLRTLSYGGGPMPIQVIERALRLMPYVDYVNAYGLTETSSTIALLAPEDHRSAFASDDPLLRARLASVGRPLPSVEVSVRDDDGNEMPVGERGEIWVRGDQVSGEYAGRAEELTDGWFHTRDCGHLDEGGFLFVHGRLDDVIVRGGENLSPGEIEQALVDHPAVEQAAVVGIPDTEWGERVVAAVTLGPGAAVSESGLRDFVRGRLRSTRTPERIDIRAELPFSETGKLLRRVLRQELAVAFESQKKA